MDKTHAFETLKKLAFERVSATEKELEAAHLLLSECEAAGIEAHIESFEVPAPVVHTVKFEVLEPEYKEFYCTGLGKSGQTSDEGLEAEFVYIYGGEDENILDVDGKIVLSTGGMSSDLRKKLVKKGALGYITTWGGYYDDEIMKTQVPHRKATVASDDDSNFPGVMMNLATAKELLLMHPTKVRMTLKQDPDVKGESRNVVATIVGSEIPEEQVVFSAHYDSVEFSNGAWDNGTGSITILELARYFKKHQPKRTMKFVWCGSEEIGLLGSYAYCEQHKDELEKMILNINFDMTGVIMGSEKVFGSCDHSIIERCVYLGKVEGRHLDSHYGLMPSDSTSFALHDVPAMSFGTMTPRGGAEIHSRRDTIDNIDPDKLYSLCEFVAKFASEIANAKVNVVPRKLPKEAEDQKEGFKKRLGFN